MASLVRWVFLEVRILHPVAKRPLTRMHSGKWLIGESNTAFNDMLSATFGQFKKKIVDQVNY
ncbi:hypothetical protein LTR09_002893 [Extremus antarcticus]|uniref:Uncharacterized protein n=1 Tax=Extremus antarcticus TaxID=702011 RepID=A0AAJ0GF84_9PEZI|nr:hypothetical protein LTR09_002893 [Extremus antarcticus]